MFVKIRAYARLTSNTLCLRFPKIARVLGFARTKRRPLLRIFILVMHVIGFFQSISAVMETRTPQGAIAWAISLNTIPYVAVPAYAVFGDSDFENYVTTRKAGLGAVRPMARALVNAIEKNSETEQNAAMKSEASSLMETLSNLSTLPVTTGNKVELLVDGKNTFESIFDAIDAAEKYILVQFYIIRADELGRQLQEKLIRKARSGVRVYLLYDDYGSLGLDGKFTEDLRKAGVKVSSFMNIGDDANRFQLNYRNHRKLVVVDGKTAFVGGQNVGDEYLGKHPTLTPWRDSQARFTGPVVTCLQLPFAEDWNWATGELLKDLDWDISGKQAGKADALCMPSGPADSLDTCALYFLSAINEAKDRIWIATPYFVPDESIVLALQLAAQRGVEVRILMPEIFDSELVRYSSYSYLEAMDKAGVQVWRFQKGFLHQKVMLVDEDFVSIGSANLDNRSFRLNFELQVGVRDRDFASKVEKMLDQDFSNSRLAGPADLASKSSKFKLGVRISRLLAPIQ